MTIETAPIVVKLLTKRGPYDELLDRVEYEHYLEQQKIISDKNDEINNMLLEIKELNKLKGEVRLKTEKAKLEAELKANAELLDDIAKKQAAIAKVATNKWYEEELERLKSNSGNQNVNSKKQTTGSTPNIFKIEGKMWKVANSPDEIYYFFKNGSSKDNVLEYKENGIPHLGTWAYLIPNKEIKINLLDQTEVYGLEYGGNNSIKLKVSQDDYIELQLA